MARLRRNRKRRAISIIELALVLPILLLLTSGILEYGWLFLKAHHVGMAARNGARTAAFPDSKWDDVTTAITNALNAGGMSGVSYTAVCSPAFGDLDPEDEFTVTVTISYADIDLGLPLIPTPSNLVSEVAMVKEGP